MVSFSREEKKKTLKVVEQFEKEVAPSVLPSDYLEAFKEFIKSTQSPSAMTRKLPNGKHRNTRRRYPSSVDQD